MFFCLVVLLYLGEPENERLIALDTTSLGAEWLKTLTLSLNLIITLEPIPSILVCTDSKSLLSSKQNTVNTDQWNLNLYNALGANMRSRLCKVKKSPQDHWQRVYVGKQSWVRREDEVKVIKDVTNNENPTSLIVVSIK